MYYKLDTAVIEITRSFESEYNNSPQFEIYTENRYMGTLSLAIQYILIAIGDGTETRSRVRTGVVSCDTLTGFILFTDTDEQGQVKFLPKQVV